MGHADFTRTMDLVQRAQSGDRDASERLFARYQERIRRHVRMRLGQKLRRDFDSTDILQDAFVVAIRKFHDFEMRDEASFLHWLRSIVEHQITDKAHWQHAQARDHAREVAMHSGTCDSGSVIPAMEPASPRTNPLDAALRAEGASRVRRCLDEMEPTYREVLFLRTHEGHSWERVAELTGRPSADAARMLYAKALRQFSARMSELTDERERG